MIIGIGSDLVDIRRVQAVLERHEARFLAKVFTPQERAKADSRSATPELRASTLAKRFAAKEACAKALGTGFRGGVHWSDIGVVNAPGGRPSLVLTRGAAARLAALTPTGHQSVIHLSLTDDWPLAQAFVILSAEPLAVAGE